MVDSGAADDFRDVRDILKTLGIDWRTAENLTRFNALAEQSLFAINQVVGAFALADTPHALPESTVGTWLSLLLQTAVETVLFPDRLPKGTKQWEDLAAIWDDYIANVRKFHLTGVRAFSEGEVWSIRGAVRAAWNIELSAVGERIEIGPAVADSAHRAALLAGERLWLDFKGYGDEASDHPDKRAALWDAFLAEWPSDKLHRQSERAKATLTHELARLRERLGFTPSPPAGAQAVAVAQASIGNVVVHNHIVLPDPGTTGRAPVAPTTLGQSPATNRPANEPTQAPTPGATAETEDAGDVGGPTEDPHDTRKAVWAGKRIYLGNDTQIARLFWLLAKPVGRAASLAEVQRAVDGMETDRDGRPDDVRKAAQRVRKAISDLRAALREVGLDDHVVIVKGGPQDTPDYTMVWRFPT